MGAASGLLGWRVTHGGAKLRRHGHTDPATKAGIRTEHRVADRFAHLLALWNMGMKLNTSLTTELVQVAPPGTFTVLPDAGTLGVSDGRQFLANLQDVHDRHRRAMESGYYIEMINLRVQHLELWLRMYWVVKNGSGQIFEAGDRRSFGAIITGCEAVGFNVDLVRKLRAFNQVRIGAVHKYMLGDFAYESLLGAASDHADLESVVADYVVREVGRPASAEDLGQGLGTLILVHVAHSEGVVSDEGDSIIDAGLDITDLS